jgi:putative transposase
MYPWSTKDSHIGQYIDWYNRERPHSSQDGNTPEQAYLSGLPILPEAA